MAISGIGSGSSAWTVQRPDATKIASDLFAKVDTSNKGYIDKASLQSALGSNAADSASDVDALFSQIDSDQDGKITKQELTDGVKQLSDALDAQFDSSRIARAGGGQPPPPPPSTDDIFASLDTKNQGYIDKEELQAAFDANSTDTAANTEKVEQLFKTLDTDGDNKITKAELSTGLQELGGPEQQAEGAVDGVEASAASAPPPPPGGARPSGSGTESDSDSTSYEAADANKDGTVSLQELVAYQASHPTSETSESDAQNSMKAVLKLVAQLTQTYGQFDSTIANSATSLNTISETA